MKFITLIIAMLTIAIVNAGELKENIVAFLPLKDSIVLYKADGSSSSDTVFKRNSLAYTKDFTSIKANTPYFVDGGIYMGNGIGFAKVIDRGTVNHLSVELASLDEIEGLSIDGTAKIVTGIEGKGAILLNGTLKIATKYPHTEKFIFSFYQKGGKLSIEENGKLVKNFTGTDKFERQFIELDPGKEPGDLNLNLKGENVTLDAMMLEGILRFYLARQRPSKFWIPGQAQRYSDTLLIPTPENITAKGAISLKYTPYDLGLWNCITATESWKSEIELSIKHFGKNLFAKMWDKQLLVRNNIDFKVGQEYTLIITWNDTVGVLYVDGKKVGEIALESADKRKLPINISVGGSIDNSSPNIKAEGVIRDYVIYNDFIDEEKAKEISKQKDILDIFQVSSLQNLTPSNNFARDTQVATLAWSIKKN